MNINDRYIELVGLSGAGKTQTAQLIHQALQASRVDNAVRSPIKTTWRLKIILGIVWFFLCHPAILRLWIVTPTSDLVGTARAAKTIRSVRWRLVTEVVIVKHLQKQDRVLINDEGIIGRVVFLTLMTSLSENTAVTLLGQLLPSGTVIVKVSSSVKQAMMRATDRQIPNPFFDEMTAEVRQRFYQANHEAYDRVCSQLQTATGAKMISLDNSGTPDELQTKVFSTFRRSEQ